MSLDPEASPYQKRAPFVITPPTAPSVDLPDHLLISEPLVPLPDRLDCITRVLLHGLDVPPGPG